MLAQPYLGCASKLDLLLPQLLQYLDAALGDGFAVANAYDVDVAEVGKLTD